jgi:heme/copper-type cytochrome/quinol oxidase subunit 3
MLALVFVMLKAHEYQDELAQGMVPATNTFLATYFTLTGLHALHVIGGVIANTAVAIGSMRGGAARAGLAAGRIRALALYWSFVDVVWVVILVLVYLS